MRREKVLLRDRIVALNEFETNLKIQKFCCVALKFEKKHCAPSNRACHRRDCETSDSVCSEWALVADGATHAASAASDERGANAKKRRTASARCVANVHVAAHCLSVTLLGLYG